MKFEDEFFEKERAKNILGWGFLLSAVFHVAFFMVHLLSPQIKKEIPLESIPIEVANIPKDQFPPIQSAEKVNKKQPSQEKQIVESEKTNNNEIDETTKYLSDKNQKADKQTRASKVDNFQEKKGTGPKQQVAEKSKESEEIASDIGDKPSKAKNKNWKALSLQDLSVGNGDGKSAAASDDKLDGVDRGESTMLSTREFKYFAYYHRIKELLRQHWNEHRSQ